MGKGGVHCGTPYLHSMIGKGGVRAKCNIDLLDSIAFTFSELVGPWMLGGDWNCTPAELAATGWLQKVGGVIHAPSAPTCNGNVYDFFVVAAAISDQVHSCHVIGDALMTPHSPSRLFFKGTPRKTMIRVIRAPLSIPAVLPHGPMREQAMPFDMLAENAKSMEENYDGLAPRTTQMLLELQGHVPVETASRKTKQPAWEDGPGFVWKNVSSPTATDRPRSTPMSRAWRNTTSWLRVVAANRSALLVRAAMWKLLHYDHQLQVSDPLLQQDAAEFLAWRQCLSPETLSTAVWVKSSRSPR